ncbi:hypothetical protein, partial [Pseudorhodobacter sp.]|uniref:hypothetical protein n=1 Tax=Pseudorhodobacter sp. TaxID=1934400 RepID=UPI002648EBD8
MKPNFALNITDTAISLLHRTSRGWLEVGEAAFDSPDLEEALGYLRASALGLSPHGITTKLILPPSQVLYLSVDAPGPDKAARESQILAALDGRTPYAADELVFDWWGTGPTVQVAVVARETLAEAEGFAETHRFNPVSFVTIPAEGQFAGEPWFGTSKLAATLLPEGEKVTRDQDPVKIIARDKAEAKPEENASAPKGEKADDPKAKEPAPKEPEAKGPEAKDRESQGASPEVAESAIAAPETKKDAETKTDSPDASPKQDADRFAEVERAAEAKRKELEEARTAQEARAKQWAAEADAKRRADEAEAKRASDEAATVAENQRRADAERAELQARAEKLAQAEAKRLAEEAERTRAALAEQEKIRTKAALIEAERQRAQSDVGANEEAAKAFDGVTEPSIADLDRPPAAPPSFASRRRDESRDKTSDQSAPSIGPAAVPPVNPSAPSVAVSAAPAALATAPLGPTVKPAGPAAPTITSVKPSKQPSAAPPKVISKPLNGTAALPIASRTDGGLKGTNAARASVTAPPKADPIRSKTSAVSWFNDRVKSGTGDPDATAGARSRTTETVAGGDATMGKFGAKLQPRRGKPRFLGLILTLVLLALLAGIAAWSSVYLSRDDGAGDPTTGHADAGAQMPAADGQTAATTPQALDDTGATAQANAPEAAVPEATSSETPVPSVAAPEVAVAEPTVTGPGPAVAETNGTAQGAGPERGPQDEIFLAAIDDQPPAFDAVALPKPQARPDGAPESVMPPPPFGTQYVFEPDGTIKPTVRGVVTPGGFWLIAAKPPVLPPPRPSAIADPAPAVAPPPDAAPLPASVANGAAAASTAGVTMTEGESPLSAFAADPTVDRRRPEPRPQTAAAPTTTPVPAIS